MYRYNTIQYIGSTHNRGRWWDNRNHRNNRQSMTISDQPMPMFQDEETPRIQPAMSSVGHSCSTIQCSVRYLFLKKQAVVLLPCWTNDHYPMPELNVVINLYKLVLLPTPPL